MDRRRLLKLLAGSALLRPMDALAFADKLTSADDAFLDDMQRRGCLFFAEQASPHTGQVLDRAKWVNSDKRARPAKDGQHCSDRLRPLSPLHRRQAQVPAHHAGH